MPQPVLTEEKRNAIVAILSVGCPRYVAARYVGCSPATIARTAARDPQFAARLRQAQASVELAFLRRIGKAAQAFRRAPGAAGSPRRGRPRPAEPSRNKLLQGEAAATESSPDGSSRGPASRADVEDRSP